MFILFFIVYTCITQTSGTHDQTSEEEEHVYHDKFSIETDYDYFGHDHNNRRQQEVEKEKEEKEEERHGEEEEHHGEEEEHHGEEEEHHGEEEEHHGEEEEHREKSEIEFAHDPNNDEHSIGDHAVTTEHHPTTSTTEATDISSLLDLFGDHRSSPVPPYSSSFSSHHSSRFHDVFGGDHRSSFPSYQSNSNHRHSYSNQGREDREHLNSRLGSYRLQHDDNKDNDNKYNNNNDPLHFLRYERDDNGWAFLGNERDRYRHDGRYGLKDSESDDSGRDAFHLLYGGEGGDHRLGNGQGYDRDYGHSYDHDNGGDSGYGFGSGVGFGSGRYGGEGGGGYGGFGSGDRNDDQENRHSMRTDHYDSRSSSRSGGSGYERTLGGDGYYYNDMSQKDERHPMIVRRGGGRGGDGDGGGGEMNDGFYSQRSYEKGY